MLEIAFTLSDSWCNHKNIYGVERFLSGEVKMTQLFILTMFKMAGIANNKGKLY